MLIGSSVFEIYTRARKRHFKKKSTRPDRVLVNWCLRQIWEVGNLKYRRGRWWPSRWSLYKMRWNIQIVEYTRLEAHKLAWVWGGTIESSVYDFTTIYDWLDLDWRHYYVLTFKLRQGGAVERHWKEAKRYGSGEVVENAWHVLMEFFMRRRGKLCRVWVRWWG